MINLKKKLYKSFFTASICFSFLMQNIFAQPPSIKTFVDKTDIVIGEQIKYKIVATYPALIFNAQWFTLPDSIAHFEIVKKSKIDTTTQNNNTILQQTILLTSFDSGKWQTPTLKINFTNAKTNSTVNLLSDSFAINVSYAPADSTNQLRDIKSIIQVKIENYFWYYAVASVLALLLCMYFLRSYFKNKSTITNIKDIITPYAEAMQSLKNCNN